MGLADFTKGIIERYFVLYKGGNKMVTVEVTDQHGGYIRGTKEIVTGMVKIDIFNVRNNEEDHYLMDPSEKEVKDWLEKLFQPIHLEILLGEA